MTERGGVAVAILSCCFGAGAAVATRYLIGAVDPIAIAAIRFGGGAVLLFPLALAFPVRWPSGRDRLGVAGLGFLFFAVFFVQDHPSRTRRRHGAAWLGWRTKQHLCLELRDDGIIRKIKRPELWARAVGIVKPRRDRSGMCRADRRRQKLRAHHAEPGFRLRAYAQQRNRRQIHV